MQDKKKIRQLAMEWLIDPAEFRYQDLCDEILKSGVWLEANDSETCKRFKCHVQMEHGGVQVGLEGLGLQDMKTGFTDVVFLEVYEGEPRLVVWADINSPDPQVINLSGAMESKRKSEAATAGPSA